MSSFVEKCDQLDWQGVCHLYAKLVKEAPKHLDIPARALRNKARAGALPVEAIPAVMACITATEDPVVIGDLAKTCAALGRQAGMASTVLLQKMNDFIINDDAEFWAYDGCLHALGHLGGDLEEIEAYLKAVEEEPPILRTGSLYRGEMEAGVRAQLFVDTLKRIREMLSQEDLPGWTGPRSELSTEQEPTKKLSPWMASVID